MINTYAPTNPATRLRGAKALLMVRRLIECPEPVRQAWLADAAGATQPRASQVLGVLRDQDLVTRTARGWAPVDRSGLLTWWLANYPGPGGSATHWTSVDDVWTATLAAIEVAEGSGAACVVSGDPAADLLAPWRLPTRSVVYAERRLDLTATRMVEVETSERASLSLVVPDDAGVWPCSPDSGVFAQRHVALADRLQIVWDVATSRLEPDIDQAVRRLAAVVAG